MNPELDWHVAVYCMNEEKRLAGCLRSVAASLAGQRALVTVILNGSRDRSLDIAQAFAAQETTGLPVSIVQIAGADKSNAINQFFHTLREPARAYGGVDGYAHVAPASFAAMAARLDADPHAVAVTGVCTNGRTMKLATHETLTVGGRLHGQLHGLRRDFVDRMVARGIRLPLGVYWGDGLLGSMAAHDLDARGQPWDNARIAGVAAATYDIPELSPFAWDSVRRQFRRKVRQMRGRMQNAAIKDIIYRDGYEGLPDDAETMVARHLATHGAPRVPWPDRAFQALAIREDRISHPRDPASLVPHIVRPAVPVP